MLTGKKSLAPAKNEQTMTSLEMAEFAGKRHTDLLRAIRSMESSWEKITERKFALSEYKDASGRKQPMYKLSVLESLYISSKFNDEIRAKLVLRWEELECNNPKFIEPEPDPELKRLIHSAVAMVGSQNRVAERLGISKAAMSNLANGLGYKHDPRMIGHVRNSLQILIDRKAQVDTEAVELLMKIEDKQIRVKLFAKMKEGGLI